MNYSVKVKKRMLSIIEEMNAYSWLFVRNPGKDFSRRKKWSFEQLMKFMLVMEGNAMKDELLNYFDFDTQVPSNSSFNQRRAQILPEAFEFLFHEFLKTVPAGTKDYRGYRLIACDGSDLCIAHNPEDKTTYIQSSAEERGFNLLHLNAFYDLCNRVYTDALIQAAHEENEDRAMCSLIDRYNGKPAIFIADRNYENYNIFAHVEEKGMYYLIRVKDVNSTGILRSMSLPQTEQFDVCRTVTITKKQTNQTKADKKKYRFIPSRSTFDYVDLHKNMFYDLNLRIVRFPVTDSTYECIITNLPQESYDADEIRYLYSRRWGIETSFRELKYAIGLTSFHSKKMDYLMQEIWSRMILYNFCEIITCAVVMEENTDRKYEYQLNYTRAIHICRYFLAVKKRKAPPDVEYLIRHELLPVRPGRTDPRKVKSQAAVSFLYRVA